MALTLEKPSIPQIVKQMLPCDRTIPCLVIFSREVKTLNLGINIHNIIYNSKNRNNPKCPPSNEQVNKMYYIHTMRHYLSI